MGAARQQRDYKSKLIAQWPDCVFCAGKNPTTTVDHVPPKQMFDLKHRPKGMECPACRDCNNRLGPIEMVAALLRRFPKVPTSEAHQREIEKLFIAAKNNFPGLLQKLFEPQVDHSRLDLPSHLDSISLDSPQLHYIMRMFGAKLAMGLHWLQTQRIVPTEGQVFVSWFSNYDAYAKRLPEHIFKYLGKEVSLSQGAFTVRDQFTYQFGLLPSKDAGIYWARFEPSFAIAAFLYEKGSSARPPDLPWIEPGKWPTLDTIHEVPL